MKQQRANHDHKASYSLGNDSKVSLVVDVPLLNQGDHWSLFAYWVIVYSGQFFFLKISEFGLLFSSVKMSINLTKNGLGNNLGTLFKNTSGHPACSFLHSECLKHTLTVA
jgi:hypothetical protein